MPRSLRFSSPPKPDDAQQTHHHTANPFCHCAKTLTDEHEAAPNFDILRFDSSAELDLPFFKERQRLAPTRRRLSKSNLCSLHQRQQTSLPSRSRHRHCLATQIPQWIRELTSSSHHVVCTMPREAAFFAPNCATPQTALRRVSTCLASARIHRPRVPPKRKGSKSVLTETAAAPLVPGHEAKEIFQDMVPEMG